MRSLRIKSQLLCPKELNWVGSLAASINKGYYDRERGIITLVIEDSSIRSIIKNKLEEEYVKVGISFNSKQLELPLESSLILATMAEDEPKKFVKG